VPFKTSAGLVKTKYKFNGDPTTKVPVSP
jgi:hypothetical protein